MRAPKIILAIIFFAVLTTIPIAAYGLTVTATGSGITGSVTLGSSTTRSSPSTGVFTTTVDFGTGVTAGGFTITGQVIAKQDGSTDKLLAQNWSVIGPTTCTPSTPCVLSVTFASDPPDFDSLPSGSYPYGVVINADFGAAPAGDEISATGVANNDNINLVPDGPAVSLPWRCTGTTPPTKCVFTTTSDPTLNVFADMGSETIPLACGSPPCSPSQSVTIDMKFVGSMVKIAVAGTAQSITGGAGDLMTIIPSVSGASLQPFFTKLDIIQQPLFPDLSVANIDFKIDFNVRGDGIISPSTQKFRFSVGTSSTFTILAGCFTPVSKGFQCVTVNNNVAINAQIQQLSGTQWELRVDAKALDLKNTDPTTVPIGFSFGDKNGNTFVKADLKTGS